MTDEFRDWDAAYLIGALSPADRAAYEEHLAGCGKCTEYLAQLRATIRVTGMLTPDDLTPEAETALLEVFRAFHGGTSSP